MIWVRAGGGGGGSQGDIGGSDDGFGDVVGFLARGREWGTGNMEFADSGGETLRRGVEEGCSRRGGDRSKIGVIGVEVGWDFKALFQR